ncbi:MAG: FmdB family zinc ribbon protein [Acidimicrobiia bacterium]|nr:FmdB family zinc ribbon protein [Acidimicrobiia bacterium]
MPTYEYVCKQCGENFDVFQSFSDKPLKKHDACGGELKKVFHARGIVFRGSGFYATDSKASPNGSPASDGNAEPKPKTKADPKPDKKPAKASSSTNAD